MDLLLVRPEDVTGDNPDRGDLFIDASGQPVIIDGLDEEAQCIGVGLSTYLGEWFLDTSAGVPYVQQILGIKGVSPTRVQDILSREIMRRGSVLVIRRLTLETLNDRRTEVTFEGDTAIGDVSGVVQL